MNYNLIELKTDEDLKEMRRSFRCRITKRSTELDARLSRSVEDITEILKRPKLSSSV